MISIDDFLYYVDDALDGMVQIVSELGDDLDKGTVGLRRPTALLHRRSSQAGRLG